MKARKPKWQDQTPKQKPARDTYKIAFRYQGVFSRIFLAAVRGFLGERMPRGFRKAYDSKSITAVSNVIFGEDFGDEQFVEKIKTAYSAVIDDTGKTTMRDLNKKFGTKITFEIHKAEEKDEDYLPEFTVPMVPINSYSIKWMNERSLSLIEDLTVQQRKVIQEALSEGYELGLRAEEAYKLIQKNIGLTGREARAVINREKLLIEQGFKDEEVGRLTDKYRTQLLKKRAERIARTETVAANAAGRRQAWQLAVDSGSLPEVERVWISAPESDNPNRPCEICLPLNGETAPVNGMYDSAVGPVSGPGPEVHPSCFIGDTLVSATGILAATKRRYDGDLIVITTSQDNRIVCTPNHPILTKAGWLPAHELNIGSHVISNIGSQDKSLNLIDHNHKDMPPVVDTISNLFDKFDSSSSVPVPMTPEDFHGDGTGSDVAIIKTNGLLWDTFNSSLDKHIHELELLHSSTHESSLIGLGPLNLFFDCGLSSQSRSVSRSRLFLTLFQRHKRMFKDLCFTLAPDMYNVFFEDTPDYTPASSPLFGNFILAKLAGSVIEDNILSIDVHFSSTHVYNLQTVSNYYIAHNVFSHNCRCSETLRRKESK